MRDGPSALLNLLYLLVEQLSGLSLDSLIQAFLNIAWLFWEVVNMCMLVASDGDHVQLRVGCSGDVDSRPGSQFGLLRTMVANRILVGKILI